MNQHNKLYSLVKKMVFAILLSTIVFGCTKKQRVIGFSDEVVSEQSIIEESPIGDTVMGEIGDTVMGEKEYCSVKDDPEFNKPKKGDLCFAPGPGSNRANPAGNDQANSAGIDQAHPAVNLDKYVALLEVDKRIKLPEEGSALVWIGLKELVPGKDEDVIRDSTTLDISTGFWARITLSADDCEISDENPVVLPVNDESSVRFSIKPKTKGDINVYANIEFFEDQACTLGPRKTKATKNLHVKVRVDFMDELVDRLHKGFIYFFTALVTLFFGALLFIIRRFVKEKTGYDEEEQKQIFNKKRIGRMIEEKAEMEEESEKEIELVGDDGDENVEQETLPGDE